MWESTRCGALLLIEDSSGDKGFSHFLSSRSHFSYDYSTFRKMQWRFVVAPTRPA